MSETSETQSTLVESLYNVGAHYGLNKRYRHPSVTPYIFSTKKNIDLFDLEKTSESLIKAGEYMSELGKRKAVILIVSTRRELASKVVSFATDLNMPYANIRWIGGTITNFKNIKKQVDKLEKMKAEEIAGTRDVKTKKEGVLWDRELRRLRDRFGGLELLKNIPDAVIVIDPKKANACVTEAKSKNIPVIAISNADANIKEVDYPVLGNCSAQESVTFIMDYLMVKYKDDGS